MTEEWRDKDGIEKNLDKLWKETIKVHHGMKPHWVRFFKRPWDTHTYVNLFVEARRLSPYLLGHIDAIFYFGLFAGALWAMIDMAI